MSDPNFSTRIVAWVLLAAVVYAGKRAIELLSGRQHAPRIASTAASGRGYSPVRGPATVCSGALAPKPKKKKKKKGELEPVVPVDTGDDHKTVIDDDESLSGSYS
uniref:Uncharacterized protein n=1 Tax=Prymnesium polylepis TaxID=72548 RepID=A0A7S4N4T8_9EUKA